MSIDQRLRDLRGEFDDESGPDVLLLNQIAERAHVRQRRSRAVAIAAAAVVLAVVAAAPVVWSRLDNDSEPVHPPTPSPTGVTQAPSPSTATTFSGGGQQVKPPSLVEAPGWQSLAPSEDVWLRPFVGTPMEAQAREVYRKARFEGIPLSLELQHGFATVRIGHNGNVAQPPVLTLQGSYRVRGHLLELELDGVGSSTFRWQVETSGVGDKARKLTLTYLDSSGPPQFGAPPEVLLRLLLTEQPFHYQGF
jgi:hypothetical protein